MSSSQILVPLNQVFVLAAEMDTIINSSDHEFLDQDRSGFLRGDIRIAAANILLKREMVKELIVVGGSTRDGTRKVDLMAKRIEGEVTKLESVASTAGNAGAIERHLKGENNAVLTQFYHLPRTWWMIIDRGLNLIPICAEAVLLLDSLHWYGKIRAWYTDPSMVQRMLMEITGLSDLLTTRYKEKKG